MTDDYKKGLVTGLAMQPLYVTQGGGDNKLELTERFEPVSSCGMGCGIVSMDAECATELKEVQI